MARKRSGNWLKELNPVVFARRIKLVWLMQQRGACLLKGLIWFGFAWILSPIDMSFGPVDDAIVAAVLLYVLPEFLPRTIVDPLKEEVGLYEEEMFLATITPTVIAKRIKLLVILWRHPLSGCFFKVIVVALLFLIISPLDFFPGWVDDIFMGVFLLYMLPELLFPRVVIEPLKEILSEE